MLVRFQLGPCGSYFAITGIEGFEPTARGSFRTVFFPSENFSVCLSDVVISEDPGSEILTTSVCYQLGRRAEGEYEEQHCQY